MTNDERFIIFKDIIEAYNKGKGNISQLTKYCGNYTRGMFYNDIDKYNVLKDEERNIYILNESCLNKEDTLDKEDIVAQEDPVIVTFEIESEVYRAVKVEAMLTNRQLDDHVNEILRESISTEIEDLIVRLGR